MINLEEYFSIDLFSHLSAFCRDYGLTEEGLEMDAGAYILYCAKPIVYALAIYHADGGFFVDEMEEWLPQLVKRMGKNKTNQFAVIFAAWFYCHCSHFHPYSPKTACGMIANLKSLDLPRLVLNSMLCDNAISRTQWRRSYEAVWIAARHIPKSKTAREKAEELSRVRYEGMCRLEYTDGGCLAWKEGDTVTEILPGRVFVCCKLNEADAGQTPFHPEPSSTNARVGSMRGKVDLEEYFGIDLKQALMRFALEYGHWGGGNDQEVKYCTNPMYGALKKYQSAQGFLFEEWALDDWLLELVRRCKNDSRSKLAVILGAWLFSGDEHLCCALIARHRKFDLSYRVLNALFCGGRGYHETKATLNDPSISLEEKSKRIGQKEYEGLCYIWKENQYYPAWKIGGELTEIIPGRRFSLQAVIDSTEISAQMQEVMDAMMAE